MDNSFFIRQVSIWDIPERIELEELRTKYNELIMAVESKFPNETRHDTALRYIKQAEFASACTSKRPK